LSERTDNPIFILESKALSSTSAIQEVFKRSGYTPSSTDHIYERYFVARDTLRNQETYGKEWFGLAGYTNNHEAGHYTFDMLFDGSMSTFLEMTGKSYPFVDGFGGITFNKDWDNINFGVNGANQSNVLGVNAFTDVAYSNTVFTATGVDTIESASTINLGHYQNFVITGTTTIDSISTTGFFPGWGLAYIEFTGNVMVNDGKNLKLNGTLNATADDLLVLQRRGNYFYQISMSPN
jgi:hypothetical protein